MNSNAAEGTKVTEVLSSVQVPSSNSMGGETSIDTEEGFIGSEKVRMIPVSGVTPVAFAAGWEETRVGAVVSGGLVVKAKVPPSSAFPARSLPLTVIT